MPPAPVSSDQRAWCAIYGVLTSLVRRIALTRYNPALKTMPVPPGKDNSVKVALIGMAGVILAALIGYFATRPTTSDLVAYAGTVKDAKTHKPLRNALVGITEDQNVPQRFTTDSEGVFFARLSKATQTMLLEITADGYQDYSRRGPTVRTGTEDIFLEPVSPPPDPSRDAEARKILSDYAARLHDLDRLVKEADNSTDIETKGADSILVYRIAYGAAEYRTSLPEFQNVPWATLIRKLEEAGVPDSTIDAIKATDTLMSGPYIGQDTHQRGYFGPGILDAQVNTLQAYYDAAHKHFYRQ